MTLVAQEICIPEVVKDQQEHAVVVQRSVVWMVPWTGWNAVIYDARLCIRLINYGWGSHLKLDKEEEEAGKLSIWLTR